MEPNQVDVFSLAVFRNLEEIEHTEESGFACQFRSDIRKAYRLYGIDLDLPSSMG